MLKELKKSKQMLRQTFDDTNYEELGILDALYNSLDWAEETNEDAHNVVDELIEKVKNLYENGF